MKQVIQDLSNGETKLIDVPAPALTKNTIIIETANTLVSAGTERSLVEFGKSNYLQKALKEPDRVKKVIDKIKTDGIHSAYEAVNSKLSQPIAIGYCNAGVVVESDLDEFPVGTRVVSNGPHAEVVRTGPNLCASIPDSVSLEHSLCNNWLYKFYLLGSLIQLLGKQSLFLA